jgi:TPR repeat protein
MNILMRAAFVLVAALGWVGGQAGAAETAQVNPNAVRSYLGAEEANRAGAAKMPERMDQTGPQPVRRPEDMGVDTERSGVLLPQTSSRLSNLFEKRKVKAAKGDVAAQFNVGLMYLRGDGVTKSYKEAAKWLRNPAEQGYEVAQFTLGELYAEGKGVPQDFRESASWYLRAAEQGNEVAQYRVGIMYAEGKGVRFSPKDAEKWLRKAAEAGDAALQFELGKRYATGQGVQPHAREAERWFRAAAAQGDAGMQFYLGGLYRDVGEVVAQDRQEAVAWFGRAAEQNHSGAMLALGVMHLNGEGIQIDMVQAHKWLTLAAASDNEREEAKKSLKTAEARMSEEQIKEAQRLAAEWRAAHPVAAKKALPAPSASKGRSQRGWD